jgi:hypothetical protein
VALDTVKEILSRLKFGACWDEKEAEEVSKKLQPVPKAPFTLQLFKKLLCIVSKDAQLCGVLKLDERLIVDGAVAEELLLWQEVNTKFVEISENGSAIRGGKVKKGTLMRVKRRKWKDPSNLKAGCFFFAEDAKGRVYVVDSAHASEVEHSALPPKTIPSFLKLDEERGEKVVDLEKDPMGLTLPNPVLGVDVATAVRHSPGAVDLVPSFLRQCIDYIDEHVEEEGLYRIPGGSRRINEMCYMANQGRALIIEPGDVENCCSVVVRWLRCLPERSGLLWNEFTGQLRGRKGKKRKRWFNLFEQEITLLQAVTKLCENSC